MTLFPFTTSTNLSFAVDEEEGGGGGGGSPFLNIFESSSSACERCFRQFSERRERRNGKLTFSKVCSFLQVLEMRFKSL